MARLPPPPFTFLVPESTDEPIIVEQNHFALKMAIVERHQVRAAVREWATQSGEYVLINTPADDGKWRGYVGEASAGLGHRSRTHHPNALIGDGPCSWSRTRPEDLLRQTLHGSKVNSSTTSPRLRMSASRTREKLVMQPCLTTIRPVSRRS